MNYQIYLLFSQFSFGQGFAELPAGRTFQQTYKCYSVTMLREREDVERGGKSMFFIKIIYLIHVVGRVTDTKGEGETRQQITAPAYNRKHVEHTPCVWVKWGSHLQSSSPSRQEAKIGWSQDILGVINDGGFFKFDRHQH